MTQKNALEILSQRAKNNPKLQTAYVKEKKNYQIACKIRECRKRANLTQKELALLIGTKQSVISRLENAEYEGHSLSILEKISKVTNESVNSFVDKKANPIVEPEVIKLHVPVSTKKYTSFLYTKKNQILEIRVNA